VLAGDDGPVPRLEAVAGGRCGSGRQKRPFRHEHRRRRVILIARTPEIRKKVEDTGDATRSVVAGVEEVSERSTASA